MIADLPPIDGFARFPAEALGSRLREHGIDRAYARAHSERVDTLWSPLRPTRAAIHDDSPAPAAFRLWFCGMAVEEALVRASLGDELADAGESCGLLERMGTGLRSRFHFRTAGGLYLFSDYIGHPDAVMGAGQTTAILFQAARPPRRIESALDLGCGAGTLALLLAPLCDRVIATDINPRAIPFTALNARLNGLDNVEARLGGFHDPVRGERFDLIVSQPPYYPDAAPEGSLTLLNGGPRGDEIALRLLEEMPDHLTASGRGIVFAARTNAQPRIDPARARIVELTAGFRELPEAEQMITVVELAGEDRPAFRRRVVMSVPEFESITEPAVSAALAATGAVRPAGS